MKNAREELKPDSQQTDEQHLLSCLLNANAGQEASQPDDEPREQQRQNDSAPLEELAQAASLASVPELMQFAAEHPDVYDLPQDVLDLLAHGMALREAWAQHENAELKARLAEAEKRRRDDRSPGSMSGDAGFADASVGGLLEAFNAVFC